MARTRSPTSPVIVTLPMLRSELLRKSIDLGLSAGRNSGVPMPLTPVRRDVMQTLIGNGYTDQDFSTLLLQAKASGVELKPEHVEVGDGLSSCV